MDRRQFISALTLSFAGPLVAEAQQTGKVYRVAVLWWVAFPGLSELLATAPQARRHPFLDAMRDLGYVEGRNLTVELLSFDGKPERAPDIMAELIRRRVDVIVSTANAITGFAKRATNSIPIVMVELTRFRGHPMVGAERSVHDAEEPWAVPTGVPAAHRRIGP